MVTLGAALLAFLLVAGYWLWRFNQCRLTVTNLSGHDIHEVTAMISAGPFTNMGTIRNRSAKTVQLYPKGETSLSLRFVGEGGRVVAGGDGYIEARGYHVQWVVGPGDKILTTEAEMERIGLR